MVFHSGKYLIERYLICRNLDLSVSRILHTAWIAYWHSKQKPRNYLILNCRYRWNSTVCGVPMTTNYIYLLIQLREYTACSGFVVRLLKIIFSPATNCSFPDFFPWSKLVTTSRKQQYTAGRLGVKGLILSFRLVLSITNAAAWNTKSFWKIEYQMIY